MMMWSKHSKAGNGSEQQASSSSAAASIRRPSDLSAARPNFCRTPGTLPSLNLNLRNLLLWGLACSLPSRQQLGERKMRNSYSRARGLKGLVTGVVELLDGHLCSSSADKALKLWNPATYVCIKMLEGHWAAVNCVFVLQGGLLCSSSDDHKIKLWDLARFAKRNLSTPDDHSVRTLKSHIGTAWNVIQFGDSLFCDNNTVKIWRFR